MRKAVILRGIIKSGEEILPEKTSKSDKPAKKKKPIVKRVSKVSSKPDSTKQTLKLRKPSSESATTEKFPVSEAVNDYFESEVNIKKAKTATHSKEKEKQEQAGTEQSEQDNETSGRPESEKEDELLEAVSFFEGLSSLVSGIGGLGKVFVSDGVSGVARAGELGEKGILAFARITGKTVGLANKAAVKTVDKAEEVLGADTHERKNLKTRLKACEGRIEDLYRQVGKLYATKSDQNKIDEAVEKLKSFEVDKKEIIKELSKE